jgi:hypothetical protein
MSEEAKVYDPIRNHLPYGGAVNIYGEIVWLITEEEHAALKERIRRIFAEDDENCD